jgi:hypothetical protein
MTRSLQYAWPFPPLADSPPCQFRSLCAYSGVNNTRRPWFLFRNHLKAGKTSYQANRRLLTDNPSPERKRSHWLDRFLAPKIYIFRQVAGVATPALEENKKKHDVGMMSASNPLERRGGRGGGEGRGTGVATHSRPPLGFSDRSILRWLDMVV